MALSKASVKKIRFSGKKVYFSRILKQYFKTMAARDKAVAREKARRAREEARRAREEARRARRREFEESHPYVSEITGRRYKTEKGRERAEQRYTEKLAELERQAQAAIIEKAEAELPMTWEDLGQLKNRWRHGSSDPRCVMGRIFTLIQDGDWTGLYKGTIREYYQRWGLLDTDEDGHSLLDFIQFIMGVDVDDIRHT